MNDSTSGSCHLIFAEFLDHLRRNGFVIGVDSHLRLYQLISRVGSDCAPGDMKTLLCPIFATSKEQQELFYNAFDSYFAIFSAPADNDDTDSNGVPAAPSYSQVGSPYALPTRAWVILAVLLVILLGVALTARYYGGRFINQYWAPRPQTTANKQDTKETLPQPDEVPDPTFTQGNLNVKTIAQPDSPKPTFIQRHSVGVGVTAVLAPFVIFALYEWRLLRRRKLVLERQRIKKPPYVWPLTVKTPQDRLFDSEEFYTTARLLRRRQEDEITRLDIEATVAATAEAFGYPSFRYRLVSRPPEYLILIDRASPRDHQARLFDELARTLESEGLYIARYYFDGDPRVCVSDTEEYLNVSDLQHKHAGHRLLIFGNGDQLVDPVTGRLSSLASFFFDWHERAVLTPVAPAHWGVREYTLAEEFVLCPAVLEGLVAVVQHFEGVVKPNLRSWLDGRAVMPADEKHPDLFGELPRYLGEETFQWLCACAVYPELHYDLTRRLGPLVMRSRIREQDLRRLISLTWFRSGTIPDELRWRLILALDRDREPAIRQSIISLLEQNPPPRGAVAENTYRLNLAVQRWLLGRNRKAMSEMVKVMKSLPRKEVARDYTLLRFLERTRNSPLSLLLPGKLRNFFYPDGLPVLGLRTAVRFFTATMVSVAALLVYLSVRPSTTPPSVKKTVVESQLPSETPTAGLVSKPYLQMSEEERNETIFTLAQSISVKIGGSDIVVKEAVPPIKKFVENYAKRVGNGSTSLWNEDLRFLFVRATKLAPDIISAFTDRGVSPFVGLYIPMIECEYRECLVGPFGAKGLYQFMPATAQRYGLDPDERCDVKKTVPAAALYLKDCIAEFGTDSMSVALGIASYNRSSESVLYDLRGVLDSENKEIIFWKLAGNSDKGDYVPNFFAAAIVGENPQLFGLQMSPLSAYVHTSTPSAEGNMVLVRGGEYIIGSNDGDAFARPMHTVVLRDFYIDETEVTNYQYKKFVDATNYKPPADWKGGAYEPGKQNFPVVYVTWQDAKNYATWAGKRLPTEEEWEAAARGTDGRKYPWGNSWNRFNANVQSSSVVEVGQFPNGRSPAGAFDMIGNVWEWTASYAKPYQGNSRVIRGGAYDASQNIDASYRGYVEADKDYPKTGFRCVKDVK